MIRLVKEFGESILLLFSHAILCFKLIDKVISDVKRATGAIASGVAVGAALLLAGPVIALLWWRRKKLQDHFFDVPGLYIV